MNVLEIIKRRSDDLRGESRSLDELARGIESACAGRRVAYACPTHEEASRWFRFLLEHRLFPITRPGEVHMAALEIRYANGGRLAFVTDSRNLRGCQFDQWYFDSRSVRELPPHEPRQLSTPTPGDES